MFVFSKIGTVHALSVSMPSYSRYMILTDNSIFHVTWQCHNREFHLKSNWAKQKYYDLLLKYKDKYDIKIHSYCFMSNHPHITGYVKDKKNLSDFFRIVNSQFARYYNFVRKRRGQLVMDRFKSPVIDSQGELLKVMYYIDLNPKRAGIIKHPNEYRWSSFAHYAFGKADALITEPQCYKDLGATDTERQKNYQELVEYILENDWKDKKNYSDTAFIGNPEWVKMKYVQIRNCVAQNRRNQTNQIAATSPPS